jgi:hypothetical protein
MTQMSSPNKTGQLGAAHADPEDAFLLMSMALDGLLDAQEQERLDLMLAADDSLRETWQQWQKMDALFEGAGTVAAVPQPGFLQRFETHLDTRLGQRRVRRRLLYGATATVAWLATLAAVAAGIWFLFSYQTQWMNDFVRELVYYPSAVSIWARAVRSSLSATVSEPQSIVVVGCYAMASATLLAVWMWFLRRTTHEEVVS